MSGYMVGMDKCYVHGGVFMFDPETVVSVRIDPQTGRAPDVGADGEPCEPEPGSVERSVRQPICDECMTRINPARRARGNEPVQLAREREGGWPQ